ncbi:MAG: hypothetical protein ACOYL6_15560 [Bacteriovoracaceae bacterium]
MKSILSLMKMNMKMKKKLTFIFVFILTCLFSFSSFAAKYSYELVVPNVNGQVNAIVDFQFDKECKREVESGMNRLAQYLNLLAKGSRKQSKDAQAQLLEGNKLVSPLCYNTVFEVQAIISAFYVSGGGAREQHEKVISFLSFIQRSHLIQPLNSAIRKQYKVLNNPNIMGAYYCQNNVIWLDPERAPLNLGSILMHELEHWAMAHERQSMPLFHQGLNAQSSYLLEEFISTINPALYQLTLKSNSNRNSNDEAQNLPDINVGLGGIGWTKSKKFFNSKNDLTLYSKKGILIKSWNKVIKDQGISRSSGHEEFLRKEFLQVKVKNEFSAFSLLKMIEKVYFNQVSDNSSKVFQYLSESSVELEEMMGPLENVIKKGESYWESLGAPKCQEGTFPYPGGEGGAMSDDTVKLYSSKIKACITPEKDF